MLENNNTVIEKIFMLKLASLSNKDQKWILKNLKRKSKNLHRQLQTKLYEAKAFDLDYGDFTNIYDALKLDKFFEKNDLDKKIDALNIRLDDYAEELLNSSEISDLVLFLYCDDALMMKEIIIKKIVGSDYFISNGVDLKVDRNDKINTKLINYLYSKYIEENH